MPRPRSSPSSDALVTGASGFLGRHLVEELLRRGRGRVFALSRRPFRFPSKRVTSLAHDLRRPLPRAALPARIGCVYHCASPPGRSRDLAALRAANVTGTLRLFAYAARSGARRFVYVSSGGVCRRGARPITERAPLSPDTPYLAAKAAGELALHLVAGPVPVAIVRLFFPFGPGQREGLLPRLCDRILRGEAVEVGRGGGPRLNPVHVRDAARLVRTIAASRAGDVVVNVAGRETLTLESLARALARHLGTGALFRGEKAARPSLAGDLRRLRRYGLPRLGLEGGLRAFARAWRAQRG
jgi:nucleoside-diphosphate-sugar epimerase